MLYWYSSSPLLPAHTQTPTSTRAGQWRRWRIVGWLYSTHFRRGGGWNDMLAPGWRSLWEGLAIISATVRRRLRCACRPPSRMLEVCLSTAWKLITRAWRELAICIYWRSCSSAQRQERENSSHVMGLGRGRVRGASTATEAPRWAPLGTLSMF